jgi:hypothetical protein
MATTQEKKDPGNGQGAAYANLGEGKGGYNGAGGMSTSGGRGPASAGGADLSLADLAKLLGKDGLDPAKAEKLAANDKNRRLPASMLSKDGDLFKQVSTMYMEKVRSLI